MKHNSFLIKICIFFLILISNALAAKNNFFTEGKKLFEKNEYEQSKIYFERDIVFNPRSEKSYLYLAKIYNKDENLEQEEVNLNNVILLNPSNDEAIYLLTLLKIKLSDYSKAEDLIKKFKLVCTSFCSKKNEMENKLNKINAQKAK